MIPKLGEIQETMLIPLSIKAGETLREKPRVRDARAVEIVRSLGVETKKYDRFMSHEGVIARTILFDRALGAWLEKNPDAVCVNLGCGLDDRASRVDNGRLSWYDVDLPDVAALRAHFFPERPRVHLIAGSVLEEDWARQVSRKAQGAPVAFVAEGLLMYFTEEQVRRLLELLAAYFPEYVLFAELMPAAVVGMGRHHDTVKNTRAEFAWGVNSAREVEALCPGLSLLRENSFNDEMKKHTFRGWLFGTLPKLREMNNRLAVFRYRKKL